MLGGTRDPTRVLGLLCLAGSRVVLIQWATLGRFMRRGKQWACAGLRNLQVDGNAIIPPPTSLTCLFDKP